MWPGAPGRSGDSAGDGTAPLASVVLAGGGWWRVSRNAGDAGVRSSFCTESAGSSRSTRTGVPNGAAESGRQTREFWFPPFGGKPSRQNAATGRYRSGVRSFHTAARQRSSSAHRAFSHTHARTTDEYRTTESDTGAGAANQRQSTVLDRSVVAGGILLLKDQRHVPSGIHRAQPGRERRNLERTLPQPLPHRRSGDISCGVLPIRRQGRCGSGKSVMEWQRRLQRPGAASTASGRWTGGKLDCRSGQSGTAIDLRNGDAGPQMGVTEGDYQSAYQGRLRLANGADDTGRPSRTSPGFSTRRQSATSGSKVSRTYCSTPFRTGGRCSRSWASLARKWTSPWAMS